MDDFKQRFGLNGNRIAVAQKYFFHIAIIIPGHADIFQNLCGPPYAILCVFIHAAEGALIVGTANGALKQVTRGLTEGPENITFVSHL